jgi:uncharacterized protein (DUF4415 family)
MRSSSAYLEPRQSIHIRIDPDVLRWFKDRGPGYQTRVNAPRDELAQRSDTRMINKLPQGVHRYEVRRL